MINNAILGVIAGARAPAPTCDPYYNDVLYHLRMQGTPGAVPTDEKGGSLSAPGTVLSSAQTKYLSTSGFFDGSSPITMTGANGQIGFNGSDFCWEGWVRYTVDKDQIIFSKKTSSLSARGILVILSNVSGRRFSLAVGDSNTAAWEVLITGSVVSANQWYHLAATRAGNVYRFFVDGVLAGTTTWSGTVADDSAGFLVGFAVGASAGLNYQGYMSDVRITKGVARYTSAFTPPSTSFPITQC